jgi:hypothetical protein
MTEQKPDYVFLGPKYKTYEGARKRAAFETATQPGEVARGDRAKAYRWFAVQIGPNEFRVARPRGNVTGDQSNARIYS